MTTDTPMVERAAAGVKHAIDTYGEFAHEAIARAVLECLRTPTPSRFQPHPFHQRRTRSE